jgi:hypothetical protein
MNKLRNGTVPALIVIVLVVILTSVLISMRKGRGRQLPLEAQDVVSHQPAQLAERGSTALTNPGPDYEADKDTVAALQQLGLCTRIFAGRHADAFPSTMEQLTPYLPAQLPGKLSLDRFELLPHLELVMGNEPEMLLWRESKARRVLSGKWARLYYLVDGSVIETEANDLAELSKWERQYTREPMPK